ncbi:MAG: NAD-dependent protein deacetylase [Pseudomonadales bacterium]
MAPRGAITLQAFLAEPASRRRYWARSMLGWPLMAGALPNAAHAALVSLERAGRLGGLITQNVDGLHQAAGQRQVLELHGSLAGVTCLRCGTPEARQAVQLRLRRENAFLLDAPARAAPDGDADLAGEPDLDGFRVPECLRCGGLLKPDVVFYGDSVPRERVATAHAMVESSAALLVVGSSLMVYSAFRFCRRARELGMPIYAINRGVTRADDWLALKVKEDCARALPQLADLLGAARNLQPALRAQP